MGMISVLNRSLHDRSDIDEQRNMLTLENLPHTPSWEQPQVKVL
jgi:hypothetical protein